MRLTDAEFERRKPVWTALSELWLTNEKHDSDLSRIASIVAASGYSVCELSDIYLYEVAPVVCSNQHSIFSIDGDWEHFDEQWLHAEVRKRAEHRSLSLRWWVWIPWGRRWMVHATEDHWQRIVELIPTIKEETTGL